MELEEMHMDEVNRLAEEEFNLLSPDLRLYALVRTGGASPATAARRAGLDPTKTEALERRTSAARRVSQEQANRLTEVDVTWLRTRLVSLYTRALGKGDETAALACLREIGKLAGLYPKEQPNGAGSGPVLVQVALSLPPRETPPSFLPVLPAPVDPLS